MDPKEGFSCLLNGSKELPNNPILKKASYMAKHLILVMLESG
jgi:hypothetical protein